MRLLLVGGFAESLLNFRGALIDALLKAGVEVHAAAPGLLQGDQHHALRYRGVVVHDVPLQRTGMNPAADLLSLFCLWKLMRRVRPDIFLGYTIKPVVYGLIAARLAGVDRRYALITGLGYAFQEAPVSRRSRAVSALARRLYRFSLRGANGVFFQNPDDQALFRAQRILSPQTASMVVNGSGVDVKRFALVPIPHGPVVFLMIARLLRAKGVREYAQAAEQLRSEFPAAVFRLVGWIDDGPDSIDANQLAVWIDRGSLEFLGRLEDVRPALAECSVYVLPSYREGTPRTVLEAMAVGRPVITTDVPGCRETVVDGENGYLVPARSSEGLAVAMRKFLQDPQSMHEMGARSRRLAVEKFDVRQVNAEMLRGMGIGP